MFPQKGYQINFSASNCVAAGSCVGNLCQTTVTTNDPGSQVINSVQSQCIVSKSYLLEKEFNTVIFPSILNTNPVNFKRKTHIFKFAI